MDSTANQHGFELLRDEPIPELNSHARLYRHVRTGARLLSLENEDENKVFALTFRTPPPDSTGIAHILEHSVLSGSRKYPLKDPFREMAKSSLQTFLNAFTYPDKTCYPLASQNRQDFYNLIDVYVDAVLNPLLPAEILLQEGWRYNLEDSDALLTYKGVVFNEMKGVYSSPMSLLNRFSQRSLFPEHPYGMDSGGDPRHIPELTYDQFRAFHRTYYHPSNAFIYFYGDDDPQERLRLMDGYLAPFESAPAAPVIPLHPGMGRPVQFEIPYPTAEDGEAKSHLTLNWLLPQAADPETMFTFQVLGHCLLGSPAAPLRKALVESGLGEDVAGGGLENELRQMIFSTGLKGVAPENIEPAGRLIFETLTALAQQGIDPETVAASLNTIEFSLRENNTGSFPRGLLVMLRALTTWLYDGDPLAPLAFEQPLAALKQRLAAGEPVFERLIQTWLLDNPNRTRVVLQPDPALRAREDAAERQRLAEARAGMQPADLEAIRVANRRLQAIQDQSEPPEKLALLPGLKLADIDPQIKTIPAEVLELAGVTTLYHDLFTNGILYLDLAFDLHYLFQVDLPYAPLLGRALVEMGTAREDYVRLSQRIGRETGGIYPTTLTTALRGSERSAAWLVLRSKATIANAPELLSILQDVLLSARLDDRERFRQIVLEEKASLESQLVPMGHRLINGRLRAMFGEAGWAAEQMGGVSYLFFLRELAEMIERDWPGVLSRLEIVRWRLLHRRALLCNATLDAGAWGRFRAELPGLVEALPAEAGEPFDWRLAPAPEAEGLVIPARVNYVGKAADLYALGYEYSGALLVANNFLRNSWLYERIRLQGGAYGAFCLFDHRSGVYTFLSYRDPNLLATLEAYDQAGQFLQSLDETRLDRQELTRNIIGAIGELDTYQLPDARGFTSLQRYLAGESDVFRQQVRDGVLSASPDDFRALGRALQAAAATGRVAVLGSGEAIEAVEQARPGWLQVRRVM